MDHELMGRPGLQTEERTVTGNSDSATHLTLRSRTTTSSTQRAGRSASGHRAGLHLSETMPIIIQLKFKTGHRKPLRRTFGVELADRSQQQGGDRLRGGAPDGVRGPARSVAEERGGPAAWPTSRVLRPDSVAEERGGP